MSGEAEHLVGWLKARDVPCPVCGYNLRDLKGPTCPECSALLRLAVGSPSLNMGPWFLAAVALALGIGFDAVVGVLITIALAVNPPTTPADQIHVALLLATFVLMAGMCIAALVGSYHRRRRWAYWSRRRQWWTAAAIFAGTGLGHALVGAGLAWMLS